LPPVLIDKRRPGKGARCPQRGALPQCNSGWAFC